MPNETTEARLDAIEQLLAQATAALEHLRSDVDIAAHIQTINTREIEKLKRHVAKLQHEAQTKATTFPNTQPTAKDTHTAPKIHNPL